MWIYAGSKMWNLDNAEGIIVEDNRVIIIVFRYHNEKFEVKSHLYAESMLVDIMAAMYSGQKVFRILPEYLEERDEDTIYDKFGYKREVE